MTQPTPTAAPPALLNITLGVMLALMLGWFFHIASGVLVPMVLGLMISYVVMKCTFGCMTIGTCFRCHLTSDPPASSGSSPF